MNYDKKQLEILIMEYFRQKNAGFPKAKVIPAESPDFIVALNNRNKIGIELTRLHAAGNIPNNEIRDNRMVVCDEIVAMACEQFDSTSPLKLFVKILFSSKQKLAEFRKEEIAAQCSKIVNEEVQQKNPHSFFCCSVSGKKLPDVIEKMLIIHHPVMLAHIWERANKVGLSSNVIEDINQSILKKDEKLRIYHRKQLNLYWLLITTDRLRGMKSYDLAALIERQKFHSLFQKVFLFDLMKPEIYQIV